MDESIEIEVKAKGIPELRSELKQLKSDLANATDPADIERLSMAAGGLADKITDINEKVAIFSAGSDFEKVNNGLALVSDQLSNMDFEGASESARLLTANIKNMNPKDIADGFKAFAGTIGQLSKAFVQMGLKLLANPLFLLVAVIGGIVIAIVMLKDKIGVLQKAFDLMMTPINLIIQGLKNLADWMGITAFAAEESADRQVAANEKIAKSSKEVTDNKVAQLDREIKLYKAAGKDATELELKKQDMLVEGSKKQLNIARSTYAELDALRKNEKSVLTDDQKKKLEDAANIIKAEKENIKNFETDKNVIILTKNKEAQDNADKASKEAADKRKVANDKQTQEVQKHKDDLINLNKKYYTDIADLNAKTEEEKFALQKKRDLEEINNLKAVNKEQENIKKELLENFNKKYALLEAQIEQDKVDKLKEITDTYNKEVRDLKLKTEQEKLKQQELDALAEIDKITQDETKKEEAKKAVREKYALLKRDADATTFQEENTKALEKIGTDQLNFEQQYALISEREKMLTDNKNLTEEERTKIEEENAEARKKIADLEVQSKQQSLQVLGSALTTAGNLLGESTAAGKAMAIAATTISTYQSAQQAYASQIIPGDPSSVARGAVAAGVAVVSGLANVKKILSTKVPGKNVSGGSTPTSTQSPAPSFQLFGNRNQGNEATSSQTVESRQQNQTITVNAIVSETQITETQNRIQRIQQNAEL